MTLIDTADALAFAHHLADIADAITLAGFRSPLDIQLKPDGTPVTEVDVAVEQALRAAIRAEYPGHAVLGEEQGSGPLGDVLPPPSAAATPTPTWIIDPIDGTRSFMTGNPVYATLIALSDGAGERLGVVSAPAMGHRWDGVRGGPARRDGHPIHVSSVGQLTDAQVTFGDLSSFEEIGRPEILTELIAATVRQRGYGDFHGFCLVAEGVMDVCVEAIASRWDFAAPKVIVEAAGGCFTDLAGRNTADGGSGVAANPLLHDAVLALIRSE